MAGRGRPASDNPRSVKVDIRLTSDEKARLDAYAERFGLTKTQVLMKAFNELEAKKSIDLKQDEYLCLKTIGRMTAEDEITTDDEEWK